MSRIHSELYWRLKFLDGQSWPKGKVNLRNIKERLERSEDDPKQIEILG